MKKQNETKKIVKDAEGTQFEISQIDVLRKVAILRQLTNLNEVNKLHGNFALYLEGKITKFLSYNEANVRFTHHQTKKVA